MRELNCLFIAGINAHLLSCRQRAIECAYAAKVALQSRNSRAKVLLSRFNPFGVVNAIDADHAICDYAVTPLSQQILLMTTRNVLNCFATLSAFRTGDYGAFARVFLRVKFMQILNDLFRLPRVCVLCGALSLPGIADAFMHYRPSTMLNLIPKRYKSMIAPMIDAINTYGFSCVQRALKSAVESSGWRTQPDVILPGEIAQSNMAKERLDTFILIRLKRPSAISI